MLPVSVIMPSYNGSDYIAEALQSIRAQTLLPTEVLVVDDCSTDDTLEKVSEHVASFPVPLKVMRLESNSGGPGRPTNVGIQAAQGECIAILDQDDIFTPRKLQEQAYLLSADLGLSFVWGLTGNFKHQGVPMQSPIVADEIGRIRQKMDGGYRISGMQFLRLLMQYNQFLIGYPAIMFRKSVWHACGGIDERWRIAGDFDFLCKLSARGDVGYCSEVHYYHRYHPQNYSRHEASTSREATLIRHKYLQDYPHLLDDKDASRHLRDCFACDAFFLRERGRYRAALDLYRLTLQVCGWELCTLIRVAKLFIHWLLTACRLKTQVAAL